MDVIAHHGVRVDADAVTSAFEGKDGQKYPMIGWRVEDDGPIHSALSDMPTETVYERSPSPRHDRGGARSNPAR
jgi:hypothetical protein